MWDFTMKKIFIMTLFLVSLFARDDSKQDDSGNRAYLGCLAYPSWHYKSCQTQNQSAYQQSACATFGICYWWFNMALIEVCGKIIDTRIKFSERIDIYEKN